MENRNTAEPALASPRPFFPRLTLRGHRWRVVDGQLLFVPQAAAKRPECHCVQRCYARKHPQFGPAPHATQRHSCSCSCSWLSAKSVLGTCGGRL